MNGTTRCNSKDFSLLKNWEDSKIVKDTLYKKACPINICSPSQCKGSVMNPSHMLIDPRTWERSIEETHRLAKDFIDQYYETIKQSGTEDHNERSGEVRKSIDETQTYVLTEKELIYGAKMAWRNVPRCIGRIQWQKLHVIDYRHATTTAEMFDAICSQLKYATNNGNIRSAISVFPPRRDYRTEFRVWNAQILRYAGYRQSDGSIIGDPASAEFTALCERLGWKGKGTRFDILPLVLQANGEDPVWYEIPEELVLEVKLRHPEYKWFKELDLKWYAVPGVTNMLIDIGGVQFAACPFNGWFMGTEIARDLCDVSRYDMLQPIARKMGLDTRNLSSFWKDKAILQINIAIIYSFQSDRVTIMDHHVATESFMKHFNNEMKLRNGCPGDWVWLVPPISGSTTPIFHQEILNYMLNPNCYYQIDAWKYYTWKNTDMVQTRPLPMDFRQLSRSVRLTTSLMGKAMSKRTKVTILYATETGKSLMYAELLQKIFNFAFNAKVIPMSDYGIWNLEFESLVLVVTSTFGNGDPPENAEEFAELLLRESREELTPSQTKRRFSDFATKTCSSKRTSNASLPQGNTTFTKIQTNLGNVKFSVFGLGSTAYPNFCAFAHAIDTMLGEMGAERLLEIGEGDELAGQDESFKDWAKNVFTIACQIFCLDDINMKEAVLSLGLVAYDKSNFRVAVHDREATQNSLNNNLANLHHKEMASCKLLERVNLHPRKDDRATILVKLQKDDPSQLQFEPGDHIGIFPENETELVEELLERINDVPEQSTLIQLEVKSSKGEWEPNTRLPVCSVRDAFSRYLDITTPVTPQFLKLLAEFATNNEDKAELQLLSKDSFEYDNWKNSKRANMVEVLDEFSSVRVELSLLLSQLPLLQCRYYSISSSPDVYPDQIHCTISVVSYRTEGGNIHHGVCSTFMDKIELEKEITCFIRHAPLFHLPEKMSTPCILVGPGTGIAPFRSFWQQRIHEMERQGTGESAMSLFYGCRTPANHIYKNEVDEAVNVGALADSYVAYSRSGDTPKTYVQNIMADKAGDYLFEALHKNQGHMYVCGDVTMAADVLKTLHQIFAEVGKMTKTEAEKAIMKIKAEHRYHEDIFGVTLKTKEVTQEKYQEAVTRRKSSIANGLLVTN